MKYAAPIIIIVLALLAANGIYVVGAGHGAVVSQVGSSDAAIVGPGLHVKLPFAQKVGVYDSREIMSRVDPGACKTHDGQAVQVGFHVRWQVAEPLVFFKASGGDELKATQQLVPLVRTALCAQVARRDLADVLTATDDALGTPARQAVAGEARAKLGIAVLGVGVGRVLPPEDALVAVYQRMGTEAKAQADMVRANGDAAAAAIRAKGDAANEQVLSAATTEAAVVRGKGDAEAAQIYAAAAAQDPQFFQYWSTLHTWRKTFGNGGAVVVLDKGSPFMQAVDAGAAGSAHAAKKP